MLATTLLMYLSTAVAEPTERATSTWRHEHAWASAGQRRTHSASDAMNDVANGNTRKRKKSLGAENPMSPDLSLPAAQVLTRSLTRLFPAPDEITAQGDARCDEMAALAVEFVRLAEQR